MIIIFFINSEMIYMYERKDKNICWKWRSLFFGEELGKKFAI